VKATLGSLLDNYTFTAEQKAMIQGSCDFYAIDGYTGYPATEIAGGSAACAANSSNGNFPECAGSSSVAADGFPLGPSADNDVSWLYSTPTAIRDFLNVLTKDLFPASQTSSSPSSASQSLLKETGTLFRPSCGICAALTTIKVSRTTS
jgi:hypothetical protein